MSITRDDIISAIAQADVTDDVSVLRDDVRLTDQGVDSLGMFNIYLVIEERYGFKIPDEDADTLTTINSLVNYVNSRT